MWCVYTTMEQYPAIKRNNTESSAEIWVDLESVIQREVKSKGNTYSILMRIYGI